MVTKLAIIHFNILEKYPPAINFIRDLETSHKIFKILVISSKNNTPYSHFTTTIGSVLRLGTIHHNAVNRYISYFIFNFFSLLGLMFFRPHDILVFETLSVWSTYVYKKINKHVNIHIHHHEYTSIEEMAFSSLYVKYLHRKEKQLFNLVTLSHTNEDRKELYLKDYPNLVAANVEVYPNLPPRIWWNEFGSKKTVWQGPKIKLVYVGALDLDTMYVREIVEWVLCNAELLELTFISHQMDADTLAFIESTAGAQIKLIEPIDYETLPSELIKYDIGLVLYKGHSLNYVFNVPNKIYEYLYCGLKVVGDTCLISTSKLDNLDIFLTDLKLGIQMSELLPFVERHFLFDLKLNNTLSYKYN